jgi:putative phosphoesterase
MKIGVVSDTHNNLKNVGKIVELFNAAGVERVVHTGDITQAKTLHLMAHLEARVVGVYGNNDLERRTLEAATLRHGFNFVEPPLELLWHERRIVVVHDPRELDGIAPHDFDVALHGHTHSLRIERTDRRLIFNPGECAGHLVGRNAVGVLDLATLETELLLF